MLPNPSSKRVNLRIGFHVPNSKPQKRQKLPELGLTLPIPSPKTGCQKLGFMSPNPSPKIGKLPEIEFHVSCS
jgi:hypothetical protein